jgi:hypothetical protein
MESSSALSATLISGRASVTLHSSLETRAIPVTRAREVGEDESIAIGVCRAMTKVTSPNSYKTSEDDAPVLEFARDLIRSENANPPRVNLSTATTSES